MKWTILSPGYLVSLSLVALVSVVSLLSPESGYVRVPVPEVLGGHHDQGSPIGWRRDETYFARVAEPENYIQPAKTTVISPPPPVTRPAPSSPVVRPPPVLYIGKIVRAEAVHAFVMVSGEVKVVAIGDFVDSEWKLDGIGKDGLSLQHVVSGRYLVVSAR